MIKQNDIGRQGPAHDSEKALKSGKGQQSLLKDQKPPGTQGPDANPVKAKDADRNRYMRGTGEGETGMQRGAGHPQGR
jgi:hypothetical protein